MKVERNLEVISGDRMKKDSSYSLKEQKLWKQMMKDRKETDSLIDNQKPHLFRNVEYKSSKLNSLFKKLKMEERKMMKELMDELEILEQTKDNIKLLKKSIRTLHLDIKRGYDDIKITIPVQIDCKVKKGIEYIRGRVYWDGDSSGKKESRHEMYFGNIKKLFTTINEYIDDGVDGFPKRKYSDKYFQLSWDDIKDNKKILSLIQRIGRDKFRNILFRNLLSRRTLGYRIRTKNMNGKVKYVDRNLLGSSSLKPNHFDVHKIDQDILKKFEDEKDSKWYRNVEKLRKNIDG